MARCCAGGPQPAGYLAALRSVEVLAARLDDPSLGAAGGDGAAGTAVTRSGLIYVFRLRSSGGRRLLTGRATIVLPAPRITA